VAILAKEADRVRRLEHWLRGEEAPKATELSRAELDRYMTERFESRKAQRAEVARLLRPCYEAFSAQALRDNPDIIRNMRELKTLLRARSKQYITKQVSRPRLEPRVRPEGQWYRTPPYDAQYTWPSHIEEEGAGADANASDGSYSLIDYADPEQNYGDGVYLDPTESAAGIGAWFVAPPRPRRDMVVHSWGFHQLWLRVE
jgi:hypothetical protein